MRIAIDGRMSIRREKIIEIIKNSGNKVDNNVSSNTHFLVQRDLNVNRITKKLRNAIRNRVEIITENQLYKLLKT